MKEFILYLKKDEVIVQSFGQPEEVVETIKCYTDHPYAQDYKVIKEPTKEQISEYQSLLEEQILLVQEKLHSIEQQEIDRERMLKERLSEDKYEEYLNRTGGFGKWTVS